MSKWEKILVSYLIAFVVMALIVLIVYFDLFSILAYWALFDH